MKEPCFKVVPIIVITTLIMVFALYRADAFSLRGPFRTESFGTAKEQFEYAQSLESEENYKGAMDAYQKVVDDFPSSTLAAEAQFRVAEMLEKTHHYYAAFNAYQVVLDEYPSFPKVNLILERQFRIGNLFLQGKTIGFLKVNPTGSYKRAINIFRKILTNAPFSELAPRAQYNLGMAYMRRKKYIEASIEFEKIAMRYPRSEYIASAKYQLGVCSYKQAKAAPYDQEAAQEAINRLREYVAEHPTDKNTEMAKEMLTELQSKKAAALYQIGRFYEERGNPKASLIYFREVIRDYPLTRYAEKARKISQREEKKVDLVEAVKGVQEKIDDIERRIASQKRAIRFIKAKGRKRWALWRYIIPRELSPEEKLGVEEGQRNIGLLKQQLQVAKLDLRGRREIMHNRLCLMRVESCTERLEDELRSAQVELQVAQNRLSEVGDLPEAELGVLESIARGIAQKEGLVRKRQQQLEGLKSSLSILEDEVEKREELIRSRYQERRDTLLARFEGRRIETTAGTKRRWWPFGLSGVERTSVPAEARPAQPSVVAKKSGKRSVFSKAFGWLWLFGSSREKERAEVMFEYREMYREASELLTQAEEKRREKKWDDAFDRYDRASIKLIKLRKIWPQYMRTDITEQLRRCSEGLKGVQKERSQQQYAELLEELEEKLQREPDDVEANFSMGVISQGYGENDRAIEAYKKVIALQPRDAAAHYNLGVAYRNVGNLKKAASAFRSAIDIAPDNAGAHHNLGIVYKDIGDYQKAKVELEKALRLDPTSSPPSLSPSPRFQ